MFGVPLRYSKKSFCLHSICCPYRSIEQDMLLTNITFFFNISRIMRDSLSIFERRKNQFLVQKSINTGIQFIENTLIRCRIFFSIRTYKRVFAKKSFSIDIAEYRSDWILWSYTMIFGSQENSYYISK